MLRKRKKTGTPPSAPSPKALERLKSGIPRLDDILKGGFVRGGTYNILGPPGSGKTILGNQMCFNHIHEEGGTCLYVTLLAETHSKMVMHLQTLDFFDPDVIPDKLSYVSGYSVLRSDGVSGLLDLLRRTLKERRPSLLVLDGLQAVHKSAREEREFDEFLHELQAFTHILGCTTLLLTPSRVDEPSHSENVVVDGAIELSYRLVGPRAVRELTVHKFRGTDFLLGRHEVEITHEGVQIHPRTEIQFDEPPEHAGETRVRVPLGIQRLDQMLGGGLMSGTTTTLLGSPGTGKTLVGLTFLAEGAKRGERGIYFGFYEPPPRLIDKAERVGISLRKYCQSGAVELLWQPPLEHFMDSLAEQLLERLKSQKQRGRVRLFIDGIEGFRAAAVYMDRFPRFLSALANQLRMLDVTTVISEELDLFKPELHLPNPEGATVTEGVILLRYVELESRVHRLLSILKMRESGYDTSICEFEIGKRGVDVLGPFELPEPEPTLTGAGKLLGGRGPRRPRKGGR